MFGAVLAPEDSSIDVLIEVAREFSPRIEIEATGATAPEITVDLSGLAHLFGTAGAIAAELRRTAAGRGLHIRVAIAGTRTAVRLLVHAHPGVTVIERGTEAAALAPLPIDLLDIVAASHRPVTVNVDLPTPAQECSRASARSRRSSSTAEADPPTTVLKRWGLRTLGDFARLPPDDIAARLGQLGVQWQRLARGEDLWPLLPALPEERFEQALDLEWPIDGLEPLSFVLARLMEPLSAQLERRDRGAAVLYLRLHLVTREVYERSLQLPASIRDARTLRTLVLLDLESHPPSAAVDRVVVAVDPTPARVLQFSLLRRPLPSPEQISTLIARLTALMGEKRIGSPVEVDSWRPGVFRMRRFAPADPGFGIGHSGFGVRASTSAVRVPSVLSNPQPRSPNPGSTPIVALRRFRFPVPVGVHLEAGRPIRLLADRRGVSGGRVAMCAGPWRISGAWWGAEAGRAGEAGRASRASAVSRRNEKKFPLPYSPHLPYPPQWDRDEWDVMLTDGTTYRIFRERHTDTWFLEAVVD